MPTDYFYLETKRTELIENTLNTSPSTLRVFLFYKYFSDILNIGDEKTEEAFLEEFADDYLSALSKFEVWGVDIHFTAKLISHLNELKNREITKSKTILLSNILFRIEEKYKKLVLILEGKVSGQSYEPKAYFPLIDTDNTEGFYGIIESVIVRVSKSTTKDNFIIIPSERNIDFRILEQCQNSWGTAILLLKRYIKKPLRYHEVILSFEKKEGFYEGNSLGTALTILFLEELMNFYNPVYSLEITPDVAFTGAVTKEGKTIATGSDIIKQKTATVFYSGIKTFVFPKAEEQNVVKELKELNNEYPKRELKLAAVEDINDILNRRDLVEIKKRNIALRAGKFIKKNFILVMLNLTLIAVVSFFLLRDIDTNPFTFTADGSKVYIKNKSGKVLWERNVSVSESSKNSYAYTKRFVKIVDIDQDRENEVIIADENNDGSILRCYSHDAKVIWSYFFDDRVFSLREILNGEYNLFMLDTLSFYGKNSLFLIANNFSSFSSAILRIDLKTGNRLPGTFWSSGHGVSAIIKDIDGDGISEILGVGFDNGYEDAVFFVYETDTLTKVRPTTKEYLIRHYPIAEMKYYLRFPKSDYDIYFKLRTPGLNNTALIDDSRFGKYKFGVTNPFDYKDNEIGYDISYNFRSIDIIIDSDFRVQRDTLVAHGILRPPYTDTEDYKKIIRDKILFWKGGKWVKEEDTD